MCVKGCVLLASPAAEYPIAEMLSFQNVDWSVEPMRAGCAWCRPWLCADADHGQPRRHTMECRNANADVLLTVPQS